MTRFSFVLFALISLLLTACQDKQKVVSNTENGTSSGATFIRPRIWYNTFLRIRRNYSIQSLENSGEIYDTYYLVKNEGQAVPTDGLKVVIPLKSIMTNSATQLGVPRTSWSIWTKSRESATQITFITLLSFKV